MLTPPLGPTFQGSKIPKFQKIQNSEIPKFQNSKNPKFQNSKIPKFQKNPVNFLEFPKFQKGIDYWNSKKLTGFFWNFGILEFWTFGILEFWNFGTLEFWNFQPKFQNSKKSSHFWENSKIPKFQNSKKIQSIFWNFQNSKRELTIGIPKN